MLSLRRMLVVGAVAVPLALSGAGTAMADGFHSQDATAGPDGVSASYVLASADSEPGDRPGVQAAFAEVHSTTGPEGATSEWLFAVVDDNGEVVYYKGKDTAGEQGVSSTSISASAGHEG